MKNFIKIFFIVICFFISLSTNANEMNYLTFTQNFSQQEVILDSVSTPDEHELTLSDDVSENSIVASNSQRHEISNASSRKNSTFNKTTERSSVQSKFLQQIHSKNYNNTLSNKSHKISPILKNEICTRAP